MLDRVEVSCPQCFANYHVSAERIPEDGVTTHCKKCDKTFTLVKSSGDPIRDRACRQEGFVVVKAKKPPQPKQEPKGYFSSEVPQSKSDSSVISDLFRKKGFALGFCALGAVLLVAIGAFCLWKFSLHSSLEKGLRQTLAQISNSRYEFKLEDARFRTFGGLGTLRGCLSGLALNDREARRILYYADKINFQIDPSKKQFATEPFTLRVNVCNSKIVLNGCVLESGGMDGWQATLRVKEATAEIEGMEILTGYGIEVTLDFEGEEWRTDPRFLLGKIDLGLKVVQVQSINESVSKNVDIHLSLGNGIFPKLDNGAQARPLNFAETVKTRWPESKAVASMDRCFLSMSGTEVQAVGKLEFRNPSEETELALSLRAKNFSRIMKFIHRRNSDAFDRIVLTLVDLDEQNVSLYAPNTDSLDLSLSYKTSQIKVNEKQLKTVI